MSGLMAKALNPFIHSRDKKTAGLLAQAGGNQTQIRRASA
jgi:hypothetical protein